jgi:hypothetical protein
MNQTKKRLHIIKLAISIGDIETIQLQVLKLSPLKTDERIQEIIRGLQAENYAQTQSLISDYIETPVEEILQRTSQHETIPSPEEEDAIIEEFDLFRTEPEKEEEHEEILDLESFEKREHPEKEKTAASVETDYDALLNLKSDDVLSDTVSLKQTTSQADDFFTPDSTDTPYDYTEIIEKDDFFQDLSSEEEQTNDTLLQIQKTDMKEEENDFFFEESEDTEALYTDILQTSHTVPAEDNKVSSKPHEIPDLLEEASDKKEDLPSTHDKKTPLVSSVYEAIPYIDQKLKNMLTQYPPLNQAEENYPSVDAWLLKISRDGYTEKEVEEIISYIQKLSQENQKAEAAQLLLISAATHSKYAQFMLGRSLFKGDILEKNLPEAFTIINRLAMDDDYPEAICDLGQLYESGIGIAKDKKHAEMLYKEAMELGIKRAAVHYERVRKANKSLFAKLFKQ